MTEQEWFVIEDGYADGGYRYWANRRRWVTDIRAATWYSQEEGKRVLADTNEIDAEGLHLTRVPDGYVPDDPGNDL